MTSPLQNLIDEIRSRVNERFKEIPRLIQPEQSFLRDTNDLALLLSALERAVGALEWIMPKVHQGNHEGDFATCSKSTCQEYRKCLTDINDMAKEGE